MRIVIATDSFKASASSLEVASSLAAGILTIIPTCEIRAVAIGDGGEGTLAALLHSGFEAFTYEVTGPIGNPVNARIAIKDGVAIVEMAEASGLAHLTDKKLAPLTATSYGTGELILKALDHGVHTILLALGGSATSDAGAGALQAMGAKLLTKSGEEIGRGGAALIELAAINLSNLDPRIAKTRFTLASDVTNPLLGNNGAAYIFSPQKGASPDDVQLLEAAINHFASIAGVSHINSPGAGAAGGAGYMAFTFLGAEQRSGVEVVLELISFKELVVGADLVITGEGKFDSQSLSGKAPMGVLRAAQSLGIPVMMVCGQADIGGETEFKKVYALTKIESDVEKCIDNPAPILQKIGVLIASAISSG
jgi:glycerate kinase